MAPHHLLSKPRIKQAIVARAISGRKKLIELRLEAGNITRYGWRGRFELQRREEMTSLLITGLLLLDETVGLAMRRL